MKRLTKRCLAIVLSFAMTVTLLPSSAGMVYAEEMGTEEGTQAMDVQAETTIKPRAAYTFEEADLTDKTITDTSGNGYDATLKGEGAAIANGMLTLPGGDNGSKAAYVELPGTIFEGQDTLTINIWLKNETGSGNYAGMYFGTKSKNVDSSLSNNMPLNYWLLNPMEPDTKKNLFKSVWTNGDNASAPYNTEVGPGKNSAESVTTDAQWRMYTTVITENSITTYYDGKKVNTVDKTKKTTDFGTGLVSYIGRSPYPDKFYKGGVYGVSIYNSALTQDDIGQLYVSNLPSGYDAEGAVKNAKAGLAEQMGDLSGVAENLQLPQKTENGIPITWSSSKPEIIANDGTVNRPEGENATVTLTATITLGGKSETADYEVTVLDKSARTELGLKLKDLSIGSSIINEDIELPGTLGENTTVTWSSSNPAAIAIEGTGDAIKGKVTPQEANTKVTLTATAVYSDGTEQVSLTKEFNVTVCYGCLMSYTNSKEGTELGSSLHLAYSRDGQNFEALNSNTGICFAKNTTEAARTSPNGLSGMYIFRKADGTYGMVARNVSTQKYIYVFDSEDLVNFTNERKLTVNYNVTGGLQVSYNETDASYQIFWTDGSKQYRALTSDFKTVTSQGEEQYTEEDKSVSGTLPDGAVVGNILPVSESEYNCVVNKLGVVKNTDMQPVAIEANSKADADAKLPKTVTANYSDGSTADMGVTWHQADIDRIDWTKAGDYSVTGTVSQTKYPNPFIEQRADPCILKGNDGYYYFTASYPVCGKSEEDKGIGYDRIELRRAETIDGLADASAVDIWNCNNSANENRYVWAPEIRLIDDNYYVFYASATSSNVWTIRPHVLKCVDPDNIMDPKGWEEMGLMKANAGDTVAFAGSGGQFSIDMTVFENDGHWYVAWAQIVGFSSILIAEIDPENPVQCISDSVIISKPDYSWERQKETVNEGPSIIKNNGKIYMAFSASGTGPEYCIGLLSIDENADLLDASAWKKQAYPVLTSSDVPGEYGPGHNSFTVDEDGNPIFVYHARGEKCYKNQCEWANSAPLYDPCRDARLKRVHWAKDGTPILKMSYTEELAEENQTVTCTVTVKNPVTGIQMAEKTKTLTVGESAVLTATISPDYATNKTIHWTSGNPSVATVDQTGKVMALKEGEAAIVAASVENPALTSTCAVTVKAKDSAEDVKITLDKTKLTLGVKEPFTLKATVTPDSYSKSVTWTSSNDKIATVKNGKITPKKTGKVTITATAGGKDATCTVTVKAAPTKKAKISGVKSSISLKVKKSTTLKPKVSSKFGCNTFKYNSKNKKIAKVDKNGKVTGVKKGKTKITITTYNYNKKKKTGATKTINVTVK